MKELLLALVPEAESLVDEEKLKILDQEVQDFDLFMQSRSVDWKFRGPLLPQEKVLLKTYLVQKLKGRINGKTEG